MFFQCQRSPVIKSRSRAVKWGHFAHPCMAVYTPVHPRTSVNKTVKDTINIQLKSGWPISLSDNIFSCFLVVFSSDFAQPLFAQIFRNSPIFGSNSPIFGEIRGILTVKHIRTHLFVYFRVSTRLFNCSVLQLLRFWHSRISSKSKKSISDKNTRLTP